MSSGVIFGSELRRRRIEASLSLGEFARLINYSKGYLSKVEHGQKRASADLAQLCDAALGAGGALGALISERGEQRIDPPDPAGRSGLLLPWSLRMNADGGGEFVAVDPATLAPGAGPVAAVSWPITASYGNAGPDAVLRHFRRLFDEYRAMGQLLGPAVVSPLTIAATGALRGAVRDIAAPHRDDALRLAARFAEYTGWMAQEAGDSRATLWWTDQAVHLAAAGGDTELAAYALVRQAELALFGGDSLATVELARQAGRYAGTQRIQGLAAQREAQGHALHGDLDECRRALDRGAELTAAPLPDDTADPVLGSLHLPDLSAFIAGWCMDELGAPAQAVTLLAGGLDAIPANSQRARARYGVRLALALAHSGEIERACAVAESVASAVASIDSATIRADLLRVSRVLNRWPRNSAARSTLPLIAEGLRSGHPGHSAPGNTH